jgi:hypothetical protein
MGTRSSISGSGKRGVVDVVSHSRNDSFDPIGETFSQKESHGPANNCSCARGSHDKEQWRNPHITEFTKRQSDTKYASNECAEEYTNPRVCEAVVSIWLQGIVS